MKTDNTKSEEAFRDLTSAKVIQITSFPSTTPTIIAQTTTSRTFRKLSILPTPFLHPVASVPGQSDSQRVTNTLPPPTPKEAKKQQNNNHSKPKNKVKVPPPSFSL